MDTVLVSSDNTSVVSYSVKQGGGCIPRSFPRYSSPLRGMLVIRCVNSFQTSPRQTECFSGRALTLGQFRPSEELPFSSQGQEGALPLVFTTLSGRSSLISVVLDIRSVPFSRRLADFYLLMIS